MTSPWYQGILNNTVFPVESIPVDGVTILQNSDYIYVNPDLELTTLTLQMTNALVSTDSAGTLQGAIIGSGLTFSANTLSLNGSPTFDNIYINNGGVVRPVTNLLADLGTSALKWGTTYTETLDVTTILINDLGIIRPKNPAFASLGDATYFFNAIWVSSVDNCSAINPFFQQVVIGGNKSTPILSVGSFASSTTSTLQLDGQAGCTQKISFSDNDTDIGLITYTHSNNTMTLTANGANIALSRPAVNQDRLNIGSATDTTSELRFTGTTASLQRLSFFDTVESGSILFDHSANSMVCTAGATTTLSSSGFLVQTLLSPGVSATYDIGSSSVRWKDLWLSGSATIPTLSITNLSVSGNLLTNLIPSPTNTIDLGSSTNIYNEVWSTTYRGNGSVLTLSPAGSGTALLLSSASLDPNSSNTVSLGLTSLRWSNVFTTLLNVSSTATMSTINSGSITSSGNIRVNRVSATDAYFICNTVDPVAGNISTFDIWERTLGVDTVKARFLWSFTDQAVRCGLTGFYLVWNGSNECYPAGVATGVADFGRASNLWRSIYANNYYIGSNLVLSGSTLGSTITASSLTTLGNIAQVLRPDTNGTRDLGLTGTRWRDLFLSSGVTCTSINAQQFSPSVSGILSSVFGNFTTTTTNALVLYTTTTGTSLLSFSDNGTNGGSIAYSHTSDELTLNTGAGSEALMCDASQRTLIGGGSLDSSYVCTINWGDRASLKCYRNSSTASNTVLQCNSDSGSTNNPIFRVRVDGGLLSLPATLNLICDRRTKRDVTPMSDQDEDILFLADHMVNFYYTNDDTNTRYAGWVAQEIQEQCPGLVQGTGDYLPSEEDPNVLTEKLSVKMSMIPVKAVKSVAKLIRRVNELESALQSALARIEALESA